ncbi:MAG: T9SS type A sorting domain-containing protein [Bacteroidia bacterium]|nr:T9SS type A sorting domain-containing protein [Bacteroidia bacterium]
MKTQFSFLLIILFPLFSSSQNFASNDTEWVYDDSGFWASGISTFSFDSDTTIASRTVKKFRRDVQSYFNGTTDTIRRELFPVYYYENNGIVEFSRNAINFDTLLNFQADPGQNWIVYFGYNPNNNFQATDSFMITVIDTLSINMSGQNVFAQALLYEFENDGRTFSLQDTAIENIGLQRAFISPEDRLLSNIIADGSILTLRCFKNPQFGIVDFENDADYGDFNYDCTQLSTSISEEIIQELINVYPNPASQRLQVESKWNKELSVEIFDLSGRKLREAIISEGLTEIDISLLSSGMYVLLLDQQYAKRFFKE